VPLQTGCPSRQKRKALSLLHGGFFIAPEYLLIGRSSDSSKLERRRPQQLPAGLSPATGTGAQPGPGQRPVLEMGEQQTGGGRGWTIIPGRHPILM